jgi:hypothetical protein
MAGETTGETIGFPSFGGTTVDSTVNVAGVRRRERILFVILVAVAHTITYLVVGALAFAFLTHGLYEGADPLFGSFLRTPGEADLWQHVTTWFLPAQLCRGALLGLALSPFLDALRGWSAWHRALAVASIYLVFGFWAAAVAAPGNIEGLVYLRPEFSLDVVLRVQPEIIVQGAVMSASRRARNRAPRTQREVMASAGREPAAFSISGALRLSWTCCSCA